MARWTWGAALLALGGLTLASPAWAAAEQREALESSWLRALPRGKTQAQHPAPQGARALVVRDEGEVGDFVWVTIYLKDGGRFRSLGTCQSLRQVRWSAQGQEVSYTVERATGPTTMNVERIRHRLGQGVIFRSLLSQKAVQSAM